MRKEDFKVRFFRYAFPEPNTGCWLWGASLKEGKCGGYGQLKVNGKEVTAHRVSYMIHKGPIPKGLYVLHTCDVRSCVNPDHLFLGTQKDNIHDMMKKGRANHPGRQKLPSLRDTVKHYKRKDGGVSTYVYKRNRIN